ncbi:MAG: AraC family transcriptional regulator, partial [Cryobacterium sp.]
APHAHFAHELLWVEQGSVHVRVDAQVWKLSLGLALWIPAGTVHRVTADAAVSLGATHIDAHSSARPWAAPTLMTVTPALREMLLHDAQNDMPDEHRARVQQVCIDMLAPASDRNSAFTAPTDRRVALLVDEILARPSDSRSLEDWAAILNISPRTLTRIFAAEVQMSFVQWRIAVRMREAVTLLMSGWGVKQVGRHLGYASVSTFVATFRRIVGMTPGAVAATEKTGPRRLAR